MQRHTRLLPLALATSLTTLGLVHAMDFEASSGGLEIQPGFALGASPTLEADRDNTSAVQLGPRSAATLGTPSKTAGETLAHDRSDKARARVAGRVLDGKGRPVAGIQVALYRGNDKRTATSDQDGSYLFDDLEGGSYRAFIETRSLPAGWLPPWRQQSVSSRSTMRAGFSGTAFNLEADENANADLRVFRASSVHGWIADSDGEHQAGAVMRATSLDGVQVECLANAEGTFRFDKVYPGEYQLAVRCSGRSSFQPIGKRFDVFEGEARALSLVAVDVEDELLPRSPEVDVESDEESEDD